MNTQNINLLRLVQYTATEIAVENADAQDLIEMSNLGLLDQADLDISKVVGK